MVNVTPASLKDRIEKRFNVKSNVVDGTVRIEWPKGHEFIPDLIEAFPGEVDSVSVGKPTLDDVFIHLTGHHID